MKIRKIAARLKVAHGVIFCAIAAIFALMLCLSFFPEKLTAADRYLSQAVQQAEGTWLRSIMIAVSLVGDSPYSIILPVLASLLYYVTRNRRETGFVLFTFAADLLNYLLKLLFNRPRPTAEAVLLLGDWHSPSFPSGHVVHYTVFFGFVFYSLFFVKRIPLYQKLFLGVLSVLLIISVSFSRVYLGAHWTSDVLGGYLVGFVFLSGLLYYYRKEKQKHMPEHGESHETQS